MASVTSRRVIGIDLGTTNTVAATSTAASGAATPGTVKPNAAPSDGAVAVVPLVQHTDLNEIERLHHLPSVLYHALPEESFTAFTPNKPWVVGQHARRRGAEVSERVITSAKSWLCHPGVDRAAAILPWVAHSDDEAESPRLSPVDASAAILRQVVVALEDAGQSPSNADVVLTVPASFDQVARQLTVEAAQRGGLRVRLLEEPQAAFYDWLHRASHHDVEVLLERRDGFTVLVVDVGGGTTDLTLLRVSARDQLSASERLAVPASERVAVERVAVGRHLLLGGDNIDLALAHGVERKLLDKTLGAATLSDPKSNATKRLSPTEFSQLVATCQAAKERLLGDDPPHKIPIRLARRGSALFGNVLSSELTRSDVEALVFDGFLPEHDQHTPVKRGRSGLLAFGLPFESDPAITHHLGQFLTEHHARVHGVLFNGGFFKSAAIARRVSTVLERWMGEPVLALPNAAPDEAVARGAVYYGLALQGRGVKFTGGSAHGYYVGVDTTDGSRKAVCVVPKGAAEDEWQRVDGLPLRLTVGKAVRFDLHSNAVATHPAGEVVDLDTDAFERVATVGTKLEAAAAATGSAPTKGGSRDRRPTTSATGERSRNRQPEPGKNDQLTPLGGRFSLSREGSEICSEPHAKATQADVVPVVLRGCLTPVGTLELACEAVAPPHRQFALAFEVRSLEGRGIGERSIGERSIDERGAAAQVVTPSSAHSASASVVGPKPSAAPASPSVNPAGALPAAAEVLHRVFGKGRSDVHPREVKDLWRDLEQKLGPRSKWDIRLARELADVLLPLAAGRRRSADHERLFFALAGFVLRPGFGYIGDVERLAAFSPLFEPGLTFHGERQSWDQFFIAWRRVAAGLTEPTQTAIRNLCDPLLAPSELKLKKSKTFKAPEIPGLWELVSWLERVSPERRAHFGQWLLERTWTSRDPKNWEWLGRTGAREPVYASAHHVVRPRHVEAWLEHLLSEPWDAVPTAPFAALQLARCTNDRARDVAAQLRERVAKRLREVSAPPAWVESVLHHVARSETTTQTFGEELPPGLTLG